MSDWAYQIETYKITMHFFETVLQTSLWPIVVFLLLLIYKREISGLISWIIKIKSLKYKDVHLEFQEGINEIKHELEEAQVLVNEKNVQCSEESDINKLVELARISTRAAISEAWSLIEKHAKELIPLLEAKNKLAPDKNYKLREVDFALFILTQEGYAPVNVIKIARNLQTLRNKAVHNALNEDISEGQAQEYINFTCVVIGVIEEAKKLLQKEIPIIK